MEEQQEDEMDIVDIELLTCHCGYFCCDCLDVCEDDFL
jgi:hypothetical protein